MERDYEEFKAPDTDNDDMISRTEFNTYVRKYLSSFPELSEKDFPKFEEFDLNADGIVSFDEWQRFLLEQKQKDALKDGKTSNSNSNTNTNKNSKGKNDYSDLLEVLYEQSNQADGFNSLQKHISSSAKGTPKKQAKQ